MKKEKRFEPIIRQEMWCDMGNGSGSMTLKNVVHRRLSRLFTESTTRWKNGGAPRPPTRPEDVVLDNAQEIEYLLEMLRTRGGEYDGL